MPMDNSKEASHALLADSPQDSNSTDELDLRLWGEERQPKAARSLLAIHVPLFLAQIMLFAFLLLCFSVLSSPCSNTSIIHSPANVAIFYEAKQYEVESNINSPYVGAPGVELDEAWEKLLQNTNVRLSQADFDALGREEGVALPDGGYAGVLNVYYELHCIKRLHHFMYEDYYFPNLTAKEHIMNRMHNEHCLDILRQGVMCHGDTSPLTLRWAPWSRVPLANFSAPHQCVKWEKLDRWAKQHSLTRIFEEGYLVHPTLGPAFPPNNESNNHLGVAVEPS